MPELIEYCVSNVPSTVRERLPETAEARPCMQECGLCYEGPFFAVDGDLIVGESYERLLADEPEGA